MQVVWVLRRCYKDGSASIVGVYRTKETGIQQARLQLEAERFTETVDTGQCVTFFVREGTPLLAYTLRAFDVL